VSAQAEVESKKKEKNLPEDRQRTPLQHLSPIIQQRVDILVVNIQHSVNHNVEEHENRQAER
jgi:hypothetical protein